LEGKGSPFRHVEHPKWITLPKKEPPDSSSESKITTNGQKVKGWTWSNSLKFFGLPEFFELCV